MAKAQFNRKLNAHQNAAMSMSFLLLSADLLLASQVSGAAARTGTKVASVDSPEEAIAHCQAEDVRIVLIDLSLPGLELASLVAQLRCLKQRPEMLAFGPHVHEARLQQARDLGCDRVLSRGSFHTQMDQIFAAGDCAD